MRGDLITRRFTDEETRRIFERAAEADVRSHLGRSSDGHTLEDLRTIALEVGLDPGAVDSAAADIAAADAPASPPRSGLRFSTLLHEDAIIPRPLSNEEMRSAVSQVEQIMGERGLLTDTGRWVEWRDASSRLYVGMVRGEHQTRVRAIADHSGELAMGAAALMVAGALLIPAAGTAGAAGIIAVFVATFAMTGIFWRWRSRAGRRDLRELLEILAHAAGGG